MHFNSKNFIVYKLRRAKNAEIGVKKKITIIFYFCFGLISDSVQGTFLSSDLSITNRRKKTKKKNWSRNCVPRLSLSFTTVNHPTLSVLTLFIILLSLIKSSAPFFLILHFFSFFRAPVVVFVFYILFYFSIFHRLLWFFFHNDSPISFQSRFVTLTRYFFFFFFRFEVSFLCFGIFTFHCWFYRYLIALFDLFSMNFHFIYLFFFLLLLKIGKFKVERTNWMRSWFCFWMNWFSVLWWMYFDLI